MYKIAISNLKGGVGKTTTTVNLAYSFMHLGKKILVVDADPQANATPFFLPRKTERSIKDVYRNPAHVKRSIYRTRYGNIDIIPGSTELEEDDASQIDVIKKALDTVADRYDICLIDTRPAFEQLTITCICAADLVLTPVCLNKFCRDNLSVVDEKINGLRYIYPVLDGELMEPICSPVWKVFATMVNSNRRAQREIYEDLVGRHDYPFLTTCVSASSAVDNALLLYKPVAKHRKNNPVADDYLELANEILSVKVSSMAKFGAVFNSDVKKTDNRPRSETRWIHYTKLIDNTDQYRKSATEEDIAAFAELIKSAGRVLQDLLVRKSGTDTYEIIAGHHRRLACRYLVEHEGLKEFEFLPCKVEHVDDVQAEFQLYATNGFIPKTDAEKLHEIERIKYLLDKYPAEFKHVHGGKTVEKIARILNMGKTTVGDYVNISKNLGDKGREALEKGRINKSAALALASLPEEKQEELIMDGKTTMREIEAHKEASKPKREPEPRQVRIFYDLFLKDADRRFNSSKELREYLMSHFAKSYSGGCQAGISYDCSPKGIIVCNSDRLSWTEFLDLVDGVTGSDRYERMQEEEQGMTGQYAFNNIDMDIDEEIMSEEDEENVFDEDEEEFKKSLEVMYDLAFYLTEQRERLEMIRQRAENGADVPVKVLRRQEYIVQGLEKLAKEEK